MVIYVPLQNPHTLRVCPSSDIGAHDGIPERSVILFIRCGGFALENHNLYLVVRRKLL